MLREEASRYDLHTIKDDLDKKIILIVKGIKKEEKMIMNEEDRQLRNLDKLHYMYEYLQEDNRSTKINRE
jgi:hypothetical protein